MMNQDEIGETEIIDTPNENVPFEYEITSYGADLDVEGLIRRIERGDIYVPHFQRSYVWKKNQASKFIESLLLRLPVPGIFLSTDEKNRMLVIDGQQRLMSLLYFYKGEFGDQKSKFALTDLESRFNGATYDSLDPEERRVLNNSIIHATVVRQDQPDDGNSSIYFIFERLNTGGTQLQPQEIRAALYHGEFNDLLQELNRNEDWRSLYGRFNPRRRDEELILRFLALYYKSSTYERPMKSFLNKYMGGNRHLQKNSSDEIVKLFTSVVQIINTCLGAKAFKPSNSLNAAVQDSVMVGVARRLLESLEIDCDKLLLQYKSLLSNQEYLSLVTGPTADEENVAGRLFLATEAFKDV